ncbi:hypothetical protein C8J56DRAFT_805093 [Mycena floridula]|nr:hypothetical protein C8J56DRAFT_805093 [Mycena floridula]
MPPPVYIPPPNVFFKLVGGATNTALFVCPPGQKTPICAMNKTPEESSEYNWFSLIPGDGANTGTYRIMSRDTRRELYIKDWDPARWDHSYLIDAGTAGDGVFEGQVQLIYNGISFWIDGPKGTAHPTSWTHVTCCPWPSDGSITLNRRHWTMMYEDMRVDSVEYDLQNGSILAGTPLVIADQVLVNPSDQPQTMSFAVSKSISETSSYTRTEGFTMTVGISVTAGIPEVASVTASLEMSSSIEQTWGTEKTVGKEYIQTFPVLAGPNETIHATATVHVGKLDVPYTIKLTSRSNGIQVVSKGIWRGVSTWSLRAHFEKVTDSE